MRVVLSRKGFDSGAGGCASPIVDGHPVSLPIPTEMPSSVTYRDLVGPFGALVYDLTRGKINADMSCHLDPDLDRSVVDRRLGWRGSLGQVGAAQSHLTNQRVGEGDLFLFWGLFRDVSRNERWDYSGPAQHRIFGWLQVGEVLRIGSDPEAHLAEYPWLAGHPHLLRGWKGNNTVYVAQTNLSLGSIQTKLPGWGLFPNGLKLTAADSRGPSLWEMPRWLNPTRGGVGLSYNPRHRWLGDGRLQSAARGQEFVADASDRQDALAWLTELFREVK